MESLFEGETVKSRLAEIDIKLKTIPIEDLDVMHYYIYYKNDVEFLLELVSSINKTFEKL